MGKHGKLRKEWSISGNGPSFSLVRLSICAMAGVCFSLGPFVTAHRIMFFLLFPLFFAVFSLFHCAENTGFFAVLLGGGLGVWGFGEGGFGGGVGGFGGGGGGWGGGHNSVRVCVCAVVSPFPFF